MKKNLIIFVIAVVSLAATTVTTISLYTDKPNAIPTDSDVMLWQRGRDYVNSTASQTRSFFFSNPSFTGNGYIPGQWHVGLGGILVDGGGISFAGVATGNGAGLTNINVTATNTVINTITNNTFVNTNITLLTSNLYVNNEFVTNITVAFPGGITNLNATAKSAAWWDINQQLASMPNGSGVYTNDGAGNIGWSTVLQLSAVYAQNFYATNTFLIGITNAEILGTDGNGQITNKSYKYSTNIVGAAAFVFGKAYWTNITADITFPALTMQDNSAMETLSVWVTNSAAATHTVTINGVAGAPGHVVPALFYCTNAAVTRIDVAHFGVLFTNAVVGAN